MCKCQDGVIEATGELCPCGIAAQAALYPNTDDNVDEQWADPEPENIRSLVTHDAHGRYLVYYDCLGTNGDDSHHSYMEAEEFLKAGGKPDDLKRVKRGEAQALFLHGQPCPQCIEERQEYEIEAYDVTGRYLVYYDCFEMKGRDDHYKYLTAEEFLEAGGKPEDLEHIRHGGIHVLFLRGKPCPHCKREERDHEFESELMLGW